MNKKIIFLVVAALLVSTFIIVQAAPPLPGAIFTTTADGTIVNENTRYQSKLDVYLDGGPGPNAPPKAAGLPKGDYFFQVTDPSGKDLLSSDHISCRKFHVNNHGVIDMVYSGTNYVWNDGAGQWDSVSCEHNQGVDVDHSDLGAITVQLYPYDDTPNRGGEYKAWATPVEDYAGDPNFVPVNENDAVNGENYSPGNLHGFIDSKSKTDNYKVRKDRFPTVIDINVTKRAEPTEVNEPGEDVTFFVSVKNNSPVEVTLNSLLDNIHGDLNGQGDCSVPQSLSPGESYECSFTAMVEGNAGDSETDTITGCAVDNEDNKDCDKDDATVTIVDKLPEIRVEKSADPIQVTAPGDEVTFTVIVYNESNAQDPLTLNDLVDDIHGDLDGQGDCAVPQTILPGESYSCSFTALVEGQAGDSETDTVTGCAVDDEGNEVCDDDKATVTIVAEPLPVIDVTKTADPTTVNEGESVNFTVVIENQSGPDTPVTITSLVDDIHGDLNGQGNCSVPQTIQPEGSYTCVFPAVPTVGAGMSETDTVTASGTDDNDNPVEDWDDATVNVITDSCPIPPVEFTVGYEDVPLNSLIDYDYNDWITDLEIEFTNEDTAECFLTDIKFTITPEARGAQNNHAFHMRFPDGIFDSNGQTTLVILDQNGNPISATNLAFTNGQDNDYTVFAQTSQVFGDLVNTVEAWRPPVDPNRTAELTISFDTPVQFNIFDYDLDDPHGGNIFFDPYIEVLDIPGYEVHAGDLTILTIPLTVWPWSEEQVAIYDSYPDVTFIDGTPPTLNFPTNWYENYNNCVYDGVACPLGTPFD